MGQNTRKTELCVQYELLGPRLSEVEDKTNFYAGSEIIDPIKLELWVHNKSIVRYQKSRGLARKNIHIMFIQLILVEVEDKT